MRRKQLGHIGARGPGSDDEWTWIDWVILSVLLAVVSGICYAGWLIRQ